MQGDPAAGPPARRLGEDEVAAILARAASREAVAGLPAPHDPTLADLMAAAADAGLDPGEVRRAAALDLPGGGGAMAVLLGAPDRREVRARLEGGRVPADTYAVVRRVEAVLGRRGEVVDSAPGRFEWRGDGVGSRARLTLAEEGGSLRLSLSAERAGHYAGLLLVGLVVWAALSAFSPLGALPALGRLAALVLVPPLLARPFWAVTDRRLRARLEGLALDVLRSAEDEPPPALPPESGGPEGGA